ncbi:MAG: preprotein translocase subunit SecA [bacterium]|nr:preprotein translocase subunit SecA [bacterium]
MSLLRKILGDSNKRFLAKLQSLLDKINNLEKDFDNLSGEELLCKTAEFKTRLNGKISLAVGLDDILPEAFALVRKAVKIVDNKRLFDVQLLGGIALHQGKIAEMKTGEGKTHTATLTAYLNALTGKGVHIVTVNDYLSRRDTAWMGQIYHTLGLSVGCLNHESSFLYDPNIRALDAETIDKERDIFGSFKVVHEFLRPCTRKEAYNADITYGTNNEFGFDYLRDNMVYEKEQAVQRGYNYAIVDEIDSILIDEARTPLIISAPDEESADLYKIFASIVPKLKEETHYVIDEKMKAVSVTDEGIDRAEQLLGIKDIYTEKGIKYVRHLEQALRAQAIFKKDKDYVVKSAASGGGEVIIVDEFTGRLMPGRRWSEGLHQAIEAKEGVIIQKESRTLATISFQNYFRLYDKLSGMTGTALTSAEEFHKVYNLEVAAIPTNKPLARKDHSDFVYQSEEGKFKAVAEEIKNCHKKGQPVLVGTVSIQKNEYLSALLKKEGVPHRVLNAKHDEEEGEIIAQAGRKGTVTVATNMAGRGVDVILGGNPFSLTEANLVREAGGLYVIGTERHEARRIDNQLRGRSGRQGDPGESRFFVSLDDDLMRIFGSDRIKKMMSSFNIPEDQPIENSFVSRAIESAQSKIEGMNFDARKHLLEYDDVMNRQRTKIYGFRRKVFSGNDEEFTEILKEIYFAQGEDFSRLFARGESAFGGENGNKESGENFINSQRILLLRVIDMLWIDHLEMMDYLRSSVNLRAYGQNDPLVEYKNEGAKLFREMESAIKATFIRLSQAQPVVSEEATSVNIKYPMSNIPAKPGFVGAKRNDPCPCGSGKKHKKCHGK